VRRHGEELFFADPRVFVVAFQRRPIRIFQRGYSVFDLFVDKTTEGTELTETFSSVFSVISVVSIATYFSKAL
jgi:hypothetical protein